MRSFSIGTKTFLLSFAVGIVGLAVVCIAIVRHHRTETEAAFVSKLETFANVTASNLAPLVGADFKPEAERLLKSVIFPPIVTGAILYDASMAPIATLGTLQANPAFLRENSTRRTFIDRKSVV